MIDTLPVDTRAVEEESGQKLVTRRVRGRDNRHNHGRGKLPEHLERVVVEHDLPEAQKAGLVRIGCEISEQLEFKPGGLFVIQHRRYKYAPADYQASDSGARIVIADIAAPGHHLSSVDLQRIDRLHPRQVEFQSAHSRASRCGSRNGHEKTQLSDGQSA
jgi:hypothetical protein